jgi:O-acetyl-ADP-ribose deacetylase (regulator of RNase III)
VDATDMIEIITGDLLDAKEQYIAHQCNCLTQNSAGIAKAIFDKFPHADSYAARKEADTMGTIKIFGDGKENRYVINMFTQFYPGKAKYPTSRKDGTQARQEAFNSCLWHMIGIDNLESIAFPYRIGCNLAGGDWEGFYLPILDRFSSAMKEHKKVRVVLYRREEDK